MGWATLTAEGRANADRPLDAEQLLLAFGLLAEPGSAFELRSLPSGRWRQLDGGDAEGLVLAAAELAAGAEGVYYALNPLPHALGEAAKDKHPLRRRWLLVDVDPLTPPQPKGVKASATDAEKAGATSLASEVVAGLEAEGWPEPVVVDSGNGVQLLYACDTPNDAEARDAFKAMLGRLAARFNAGARIDPKVYNAGRIAKLPGTWARKGPDTPDRPHRMARVVSAPARPARVTLEQVRAAFAPTPAPPPAAATPAGEPNGRRWSWATQTATGPACDPDARQRAALYLDACAPAVSGQGGHGQTMSVARGVVWGFALGQDAGYALLEERYNPRCQPRWSERELRHKCKDAEETADPSGRPRGYLLEDSRRGVPPHRQAAVAQPEKEPRKGPTLYRADELVRMTLPEPRWVVPGLLSEGVTVLAGKPKLGKSWLALAMGLTVAHGGKVLGQMDSVVGDVLYLALEDRPRRLQDRLRKLLSSLGHEAPARLKLAVEYARLGKGALEDVEAWADTCERPTLVIVDVWQKFRPPTPPKGGGYDNDYEVLGSLKGGLDKLCLSAIIVHHCKKAKEDDALDEISGTNGIAGAADGVMILTRPRAEDDRPVEGNLFLTGRDIAEEKVKVTWDPATFLWTRQPRAEAEMDSPLMLKILALLRSADGAYTPAEVQAEFPGEKQDTVTRYLSRLRAKGLLEKVGPRYRAADTGD